jgi:hypothetical protein
MARIQLFSSLLLSRLASHATGAAANQLVLHLHQHRAVSSQSPSCAIERGPAEAATMSRSAAGVGARAADKSLSCPDGFWRMRQTALHGRVELRAGGRSVGRRHTNAATTTHSRVESPLLAPIADAKKKGGTAAEAQYMGEMAGWRYCTRGDSVMARRARGRRQSEKG